MTKTNDYEEFTAINVGELGLKFINNKDNLTKKLTMKFRKCCIQFFLKRMQFKAFSHQNKEQKPFGIFFTTKHY